MRQGPTSQHYPHPTAPLPTSHRVMGGRIGHELGGPKWAR
jgi:hypothetical protein